MTTTLDSFSDEELAARAKAGSAGCFEEIVRRYQTPLLRFLMKRFPSRRDAEDILQDTFLKAWQSLHLFDDRYTFRTWMYTIAYRLAVSRGRRLAIEEPLLTFDMKSPGQMPHESLMAADERESLWTRAREILSDEQFMALWLYYVDELPAPDIARILNKSWVSVKTLMHRARKKLSPCLADPALAIASTPGPPRPAIDTGDS